MTKKKILIATGGTGGHVFPAYSLARYLTNHDYDVEITSDKRGLDFLQNYKDLKITKIPSSSLKRKNLSKSLISLITIFFSIVKSILILSSKRPLIVFGTGGYASFPVCIAASILRIKFVIYENNLIIGKANKHLLPFAKKIFVSYNELTGLNEKYNYKVFQIGNIIREDIINSNISQDDLSKFDSIKILVLGGSQAARVFADALPQVFEQLKGSQFSIKIYQQCQKQQNAQLSQLYKKAKIDHEIFNFTDKIIDYYSKANLVITRSGASVLGELVNLKIPFISIPLPTSADDHQYKNAEFYKKKGYGFLLNEKDIKDKLCELIISIFKDKSSIKNILSNQGQYADKGIFKNLETQLEKVINEKD